MSATVQQQGPVIALAGTQPKAETEATKPASSKDTGQIGWLPLRLVTWVYLNVRHMASEAMEYFHGNDKRLSDRSLKTVFVGAGPVGLWTAIQHKLNNPKADITIFDKYSAYKRSHTVRVDVGSFSGACRNEGLRKLENKIRKQHGRIACNELEGDLKKIAADLNIKVRKEAGAEVVNIGPDSVTLKSGETCHYDQLVGADGAHSPMRKAMILDQLENNGTVNLNSMSKKDENDEFSMRREVQHKVRVKYQVTGDTRRLNRSWSDWARYAYPASKVIGSPVDEHISQPDEEGIRTVTLDFFISEDEYKELNINGHDLKKPASMNDLPKTLADKIALWQEVKREFASEKKVPGSEQASPYALMYFQARKVATLTSASKPVYLVGDSCTALPYFRSLNNGLLCGSHLGKCLARGDLKPRRIRKHSESYTNLANIRARKEFVVARLKDRAVNLMTGVLKLANKLPFQISYLDPGMVRSLMTGTV